MTAYDLTWADVDPDRNPFDPRDLAPIVAGALVGRPFRPLTKAEKKKRKKRRPFYQGGWRPLNDVHFDLVREYGPWAEGWSLAQSSGGVVRSWCCPSHSYTADTDATLQRIVASLREWRAFIQAMAALFGELRPDLERARAQAPDARRATLARLTVRLVREVADATQTEDAWYGLTEQVAAWLLESAGMPATEARRRAEEALTGKFQSWIGPSDEELEQAGQALHEALAPWLADG